MRLAPGDVLAVLRVLVCGIRKASPPKLTAPLVV